MSKSRIATIRLPKCMRSWTASLPRSINVGAIPSPRRTSSVRGRITSARDSWTRSSWQSTIRLAGQRSARRTGTPPQRPDLRTRPKRHAKKLGPAGRVLRPAFGTVRLGPARGWLYGVPVARLGPQLARLLPRGGSRSVLLASGDLFGAPEHFRTGFGACDRFSEG